jgi:Na+-driven multidrug efflux pump
MFGHKHQQFVPFLIALALVLVFAATASACPNCKEALAANDPEQSGIVKGYFYSILFMMGMPFAFLGCFSFYMYRQVLRARAQRTSQTPAMPSRELVGQR